MEQSVRWVDRLFARLHIRYGDAWIRKWEGLPLEAVKADWHAALERLYDRCPEALAYALDHLPPEFPPNSDGFLKIALAHQPKQQALPAPNEKADPAVLKVVKAALEKPQGYDPAKECADRLRAIPKLSLPQRHQLQALEAIGK